MTYHVTKTKLPPSVCLLKVILPFWEEKGEPAAEKNLVPFRKNLKRAPSLLRHGFLTLSTPWQFLPVSGMPVAQSKPKGFGHLRFLQTAGHRHRGTDVSLLASPWQEMLDARVCSSGLPPSALSQYFLALSCSLQGPMS